MINERSNPLGDIYISHRAIATIAYQAVYQSYGVVGLAAKNFAEGLAQAIVKDPMSGIEVHFNGESIQIDLFIVVEYGTRIKSVASSVSDTVKYQIEKILGIPVTRVDVHVRGLRVSNPD